MALWHDHLAVAYAVAFSLSAGQVFFSPAAQSLPPSVVRDDELVAANSGIWTAAVVAQIAVAPAAALLAVQVGFGPAFTVNSVSFALSAVVLRGLSEPERPRPVEVTSSFRARPRGPRHPEPGPAAEGPGRRAVPRRTVRRSDQRAAGRPRPGAARGRRGYGLLVAAIGAGAALGPLMVLRRIKDTRRPLLVFGPYAVRGLVDLVLVLATSVPLAAAALVVYGLSTSTGSVTFSRLVQSRVPAHLRGRAFAGFDVVWQTGRMLSPLLGGLLADTIGIRAVYLLGSLLLLAAAAVGAGSAPRLRQP